MRFWRTQSMKRLVRLVTQKLLAAMFAAKVIGLAVARGAKSGRFVHRHAANGINRHDLLYFSLTARRLRPLSK